MNGKVNFISEICFEYYISLFSQGAFLKEHLNQKHEQYCTTCYV